MFYGCPFYLRARHGEWTIDVCKTKGDPVMNGELLHLEGDDDTDGYMTVEEGMRIVGSTLMAFIDKYHRQIWNGDAYP
jgi:hypothetical protein